MLSGVSGEVSRELCGADAGPSKSQEAQTPGKTPKKILKGSLKVEEVKEGSGPECKSGNLVGLYYEGESDISRILSALQLYHLSLFRTTEVQQQDV